MFPVRNPFPILALVGGLLCIFACFSITLWLVEEFCIYRNWVLYGSASRGGEYPGIGLVN